jgi:transcriptional regulator with XRE-family HTH domain
MIGLRHALPMDRIRFGRSVKELRVRRRWRQQDLAAASGISSSAVGRIEHGAIARVPWADLVSVAEALEGRLGLDFHWRGGDLDRLLDAAHASIVEALVRVYRAAGWEVVVEATFSEYGERGSIDVLAWHPARGAIAVNEVKATVTDAGRTVTGVDRKARLAPIVAKRLGWTCLAVSRFLVVAEGATSRRRIAEHAATFGAAFPLGGRESRAWIAGPSGRSVAGLIFLSSAHRVGAIGSSPPAGRVRRPNGHTGRWLDRPKPSPDKRDVGS